VTVENVKLHECVSMLEQQNRSLHQQLMDLSRSVAAPVDPDAAKPSDTFPTLRMEKVSLEAPHCAELQVCCYV
jgi:hypothetical protein